MTKLDSFVCPNCGAAADLSQMVGSMLKCPYCQTTYRIPETLTPEPDVGNLLLGAEFTGPDVPGWRLRNKEHISFSQAERPELVAHWPKLKESSIFPVLHTPGFFDDFDISVTIRFLEGDREYISAGFELRDCEEGNYVIRISAQGTFQVAWHKGTDWGGDLVDWSSYPDLRSEMGESNRLRVIALGTQLRVYLNGALVTSLRDDRFSSGKIRLVVTPNKHKSIKVAFSDLQLREVKK